MWNNVLLISFLDFNTYKMLNINARVKFCPKNQIMSPLKGLFSNGTLLYWKLKQPIHTDSSPPTGLNSKFTIYFWYCSVNKVVGSLYSNVHALKHKFVTCLILLAIAGRFSEHWRPDARNELVLAHVRLLVLRCVETGHKNRVNILYFIIKHNQI